MRKQPVWEEFFEQMDPKKARKMLKEIVNNIEREYPIKAKIVWPRKSRKKSSSTKKA